MQRPEQAPIGNLLIPNYGQLKWLSVGYTTRL